jgi:hypothetical protein
LASEIRPQLTAGRRTTNRRGEDQSEKEIVASSETVDSVRLLAKNRISDNVGSVIFRQLASLATIQEGYL